MNKQRHIWVVTDDKSGHINQSLGLLEALQRRLPVLTWQLIPIMSIWQTIRFAWQHKQQTPELVVSTGHRTHRTLLILSKIVRIPAIVLMKPSLPLRWFDLCIIPEHDSPPKSDNVIISRGALNRMQAGKKNKNTGLLLIGGPSKHFDWDSQEVVNQIKHIVQQFPSKWLLTTSPRTPDETLEQLRKLSNIEIIPYHETDDKWLPTTMSHIEQCWVTEDSVSMIFEALTAGCQVGLIELNGDRDNRITQGIKTIRDAGYVRTLLDHNATPRPPLAEADRCAQLVQKRFLT